MTSFLGVFLLGPRRPVWPMQDGVGGVGGVLHSDEGEEGGAIAATFESFSTKEGTSLAFEGSIVCFFLSLLFVPVHFSFILASFFSSSSSKSLLSSQSLTRSPSSTSSSTILWMNMIAPPPSISSVVIRYDKMITNIPHLPVFPPAPSNHQLRLLPLPLLIPGERKFSSEVLINYYITS